MVLYWIFGILISLIFLVFLISFICFLMVFYRKKRKPLKDDEFDFPPQEVYKPYKEQLLSWMKKARELPHEEVEITSFDNLTLRGKYYEKEKGLPIEILFNGYKGTSERDLSAGIERCFSINRNVLLVDQRACGRSDGNVTTFGVKERFDAVKWAEFASKKFGDDAIILLGGVSLGAATVLNASKEILPKNVKCILADCSFSSPKEIITKVVKEMHLPPFIFYPFIKIGARIFGAFNLDEISPVEAVKEAKLPIYLVHGDIDDYVPFYMSEKIYENIKTDKKALVKIKGAGHGLGYPADKKAYLKGILDFEKHWK
jgi:fermentation-respiration switch protein FrsA (DUF1100 family)